MGSKTEKRDSGEGVAVESGTADLGVCTVTSPCLSEGANGVGTKVIVLTWGFVVNCGWAPRGKGGRIKDVCDGGVSRRDVRGVSELLCP